MSDPLERLRMPIVPIAPRRRSASTLAARSSTRNEIRLCPPGSGRLPSGSTCGSPGTVSSSRRSPRYSIAKTGDGRSSSSNPSRSR